MARWFVAIRWAFQTRPASLKPEPGNIAEQSCARLIEHRVVKSACNVGTPPRPNLLHQLFQTIPKILRKRLGFRLKARALLSVECGRCGKINYCTQNGHRCAEQHHIRGRKLKTCGFQYT